MLSFFILCIWNSFGYSCHCTNDYIILFCLLFQVVIFNKIVIYLLINLPIMLRSASSLRSRCGKCYIKAGICSYFWVPTFRFWGIQTSRLKTKCSVSRLRLTTVHLVLGPLDLSMSFWGLRFVTCQRATYGSNFVDLKFQAVKWIVISQSIVCCVGN